MSIISYTFTLSVVATIAFPLLNVRSDPSKDHEGIFLNFAFVKNLDHKFKCLLFECLFLEVVLPQLM